MFKGIALSWAIIVLLLIGPAYLLAFIDPDYEGYCVTAIYVPCIGSNDWMRN